MTPITQRHKQNRLPKPSIVKTIALISLRILIFILIALAILPVALLFISTSVPVSILILFAMAEVALFVAVFRLGFTARVLLAELAGFVAIALLAIFASQLFASTPLILDANGNPIPNSIAVLEKVKLGGAEEWITIRGKDSRNPVLLFLAGGPGGSHIFVPLQMVNSGYDHNNGDLAVGYPDQTSVPADFIDMTILYAAGGLYSTVEDLYRWNQALYTDKLIPKNLRDMMFTPFALMPDNGGLGYGYGWVIGKEGNHPIISHEGGINGFHSVIVRYPKDKIIIIILGNRQDMDLFGMRTQIAKIVFGVE